MADFVPGGAALRSVDGKTFEREDAIELAGHPVEDTGRLSLGRRGLSAQSPILVALLGAVAALPPLSIDMGLPALTGIQAGLHATARDAALTLSLFLLGFSGGPLMMGPLSDRFGRRPVLLCGLVLFTLAGLGCCVAPDITVLLAARLLQGIGAGAAATIPMTAVRDLYRGSRGRTMMSHVALVTGLAPIVAPTLGASLLAVGPWRLIYGALTGVGVVLFALCLPLFPESAPAGRHLSLHPRAIIVGYAEVLTHRSFLGNAVMIAAGFACMFAFVGGSPLVFMHVLGVSPRGFGAIFAIVAAMLMLGALVNGRAAARGVSGERMRDLALGLLTGSACVLAVIGLAGAQSLASLVPALAVSLFAQGILMPAGTHAALQSMGHRAGTAAAALRGLQMIAAFASSMAVASFFDGHSARSLGLTMLICAGIAVTSRLFLLGRRPEIDHEAGA